MTGQITLIFQFSLQGARRQARAGLHAGAVLVGKSRPACVHNQEGWCGRPATGRGWGELPHLPAIGRDRGRGRRSAEGVVHGAATASQVRPSVGGRGGGGWIREAGHCGVGKERAEQRLSEAHRSRRATRPPRRLLLPAPGWTPPLEKGGGVPKAASREEVKVRFQTEWVA